jgi:hypothetical protein
MELKSLTQRIKCVGAESGCLSMLKECLVFSSMRLGIPFIAPMQLGAVGDQSWKANLAFCRVVHRTVTVAVRCTISFQIRCIRPLLLGAGWGTGHCSMHTGQSGAPSRPLERATCRALAQLAHRTVQCTTGQSGEF